MKPPIDLDRLSDLAVADAPPLTNEQVEDLRRNLAPMAISAAAPAQAASRRPRRRAA